MSTTQVVVDAIDIALYGFNNDNVCHKRLADVSTKLPHGQT